MNFYNKVLDKKGLKRIVSWFIENYGPTRTNLLLDEFKSVGFHYAGKAGLSLGFDDLRIPFNKQNLLAAAQDQVRMCEKTYLMGKITAFERYQKLIDIWTTTSEKLKDEVIQNFETIQGGPLASPLYMMAFSGARGNISQVRQLVGMRGLMSDSGGGIIDFPIRSNFREGLSVTEYVISCYGARKGLIDTALRTADSGYLTRRLVDVAHGIIIREIDCGSYESVFMKLSDTKNLIGRVLAETVSLPQKNSGLTTEGPKGAAEGSRRERDGIRSGTSWGSAHRRFWRNQEISPRVAFELKTLKGSKASIAVRSPLTCLSQSVCQMCYGWNLAQGRLVSLGEAVGILAAQSIGEPGTQLTMRTFHTGGIFSTEVEDKVYSPQEGILCIQSPVDNRSAREETALLLRPSSAATAVAGSPVLLRGCKIRSVHGQTAFFLFESIQLKIQNWTVKDQRSQPSLEERSSPPDLRSGEDQRSQCSEGLEHERTEGLSWGSARCPSVAQSGPPAGSGTLFCRESILKLPPQSILFVSPGNTVKKNTLFAEISRIQQPPNNLDENQAKGASMATAAAAAFGSRSRKKNSVGQTPTDHEIERNSIGERNSRADLWSGEKRNSQLDLRGTPPAEGPRSSQPKDSRSSVEEAEGLKKQKSTQLRDNLQLASRKVFSEIQGEVMEIFQTQKRTLTFPGPSDRSGLTRPKAAGPAAGTFVELRSKPRNPAGRSHSIERGMSEVSDRRNPVGPWSRSPGPTKLRVVLSGEPFVFQKQDRPTNSSGFRRGDIVFWKGQRKELVSPVFQHQTSKADLRKDLWSSRPSVGRQLRATAGHLGGAEPQPRPPVLRSFDPFEIRRVQEPDARTGGTPPTTLKGKPSVANEVQRPKTSTEGQELRSSGPSNFENQLQYSGLVVHFEHQKEKQTVSALPKSLKYSTANEQIDNPSVFTKKNQRENIGKLCQPYRDYKTFFGNQTPSLNLPTQILRRRKNKLIFRHVQVSLGMDVQNATADAAEGSRAGRSTVFLGSSSSGGEASPPDQMFAAKNFGSSTDQRSRAGGPLSSSTKGGADGEPAGGALWSSTEGRLTSFSHYVKERDLLFQLILPISQSSSSSDIVQGLPKIEQLFEARARFSDTNSKQSPPTGAAASGRSRGELRSRAEGGGRSPGRTFGQPTGTSPGKTSALQGPKVFGRELRGAPPTEASSFPNSEESEKTKRTVQEPQSSTLELRNLQKRLIQEIQSVYNSQGVDIADKHLEIIVRQMTSQIRVLEKGTTPYFPGDIVNGVLFNSSKLASGRETYNSKTLLPNLTHERSAKPRWAKPRMSELPAEGELRPPEAPNRFSGSAGTAPSITRVSSFKQEPASDWVLMGITKVALLATTESYISAASFQETKRVLMNSALQNRVDFFEGLKENVIVGRMIPAGTGSKD